MSLEKVFSMAQINMLKSFPYILHDNHLHIICTPVTVYAQTLYNHSTDVQIYKKYTENREYYYSSGFSASIITMRTILFLNTHEASADFINSQTPDAVV